MIERARMFGDDGSLACVVCEPAAQYEGNAAKPEGAPGVPAVIVWNAGLLHHVGPNRLFVEMCRRLAEVGFLSLRFDLSGIGDSGPGNSPLPAEERALAEARTAMDFLATTRAVERFVLIGLCSGAVDAHHVAVRDERVCGVVMLDGYGYRTPGFYLRHFGSGLLSPPSWVRGARRLVRGDFATETFARTRAEHVERLNYRRFPERDRVRRDLAGLVARDTELLYVYTGGVDGYYNHTGQFRAMLPGLGRDRRVQLVFRPQADHLHASPAARAELIAEIIRWMTTRFSPAHRREGRPGP